MKRSMLILLVTLLGNSFSYGQCVIFSCSEKHLWAASYNDKNEHYSISELGNMASAECKKRGGTHCRRLYISKKAGWFGIMLGKSWDGKYIMQAVDGAATESEAIAETRKRYTQDGGADANGYKVYTWQVYANVTN